VRGADPFLSAPLALYGYGDRLRSDRKARAASPARAVRAPKPGGFVVGGGVDGVTVVVTLTVVRVVAGISVGVAMEVTGAGVPVTSGSRVTGPGSGAGMQSGILM